jgi:hypothetical protein
MGGGVEFFYLTQMPVPYSSYISSLGHRHCFSEFIAVVRATDKYFVVQAGGNTSGSMEAP